MEENNSTIDERVYELQSSLPNKSMNPDGTVTDLAGNIIDPATANEDWLNKPSLPNKWLNPDGSISTLSEIIASIVDTDIFVVVEQLPESGNPKKIYLVPNGSGGFDEYHWTGTKWDNIGMIEFDLSNYDTKEQVNAKITAALAAAKSYADNILLEAKSYTDTHSVTFKPYPSGFDTSHTTQQFINSIKALNLTAGMAYLGGVTLTDMPFQGNAEVEVYVYSSNVIYLVLRSANVSPYLWDCNSHTFRGWEPVGKAYTDAQITARVGNLLGGAY